MKRAILPLSLVTLGVCLFGWLIWTAFESQRADVAVARSFLTHIAAAEYDEAQALMTPALMAQAGPDTLTFGFGTIEPWERIRFTSRQSNNTGDLRRTDLSGRGITVTGCESTLRMRLVNGLIDAFDVTPLCPATGVDA